MNSRFIAIAGNIGSGKSTLTSLLADRYQWTPYYESVTDNPYLSDFYADMKRWSLQLQIYFLNKRFQAHENILKDGGLAVQDRSIYEDAHIFARALRDGGQMEERDYENYFHIYQTMINFLKPPDLVVYLRRSVDVIVKRIKQRGRDFEANIPRAYLETLHNCYDDWIENYEYGKVLTVEGDDLDLKHNPEHFEYVYRKIQEALEQPDENYVASCGQALH